jgi:hypothetical protein
MVSCIFDGQEFLPQGIKLPPKFILPSLALVQLVLRILKPLLHSLILPLQADEPGVIQLRSLPINAFLGVDPPPKLIQLGLGSPELILEPALAVLKVGHPVLQGLGCRFRGACLAAQGGQLGSQVRDLPLGVPEPGLPGCLLAGGRRFEGGQLPPKPGQFLGIAR